MNMMISLAESFTGKWNKKDPITTNISTVSAFHIPETLDVSAVCTVGGGAGGAGCAGACAGDCVGLEGWAGLKPGLWTKPWLFDGINLDVELVAVAEWGSIWLGTVPGTEAIGPTEGTGVVWYWTGLNVGGGPLWYGADDAVEYGWFAAPCINQRSVFNWYHAYSR